MVHGPGLEPTGNSCLVPSGENRSERGRRLLRGRQYIAALTAKQTSTCYFYPSRWRRPTLCPAPAAAGRLIHCFLKVLCDATVADRRNSLFTLQKSPPPGAGFSLTKTHQNFNVPRALEDLPRKAPLFNQEQTT